MPQSGRAARKPRTKMPNVQETSTPVFITGHSKTSGERVTGGKQYATFPWQSQAELLAKCQNSEKFYQHNLPTCTTLQNEEDKHQDMHQQLVYYCIMSVTAVVSCFTLVAGCISMLITQRDAMVTGSTPNEIDKYLQQTPDRNAEESSKEPGSGSEEGSGAMVKGSMSKKTDSGSE